MILVLAKAIPKDEDACEKIVEFAQDLIETLRKKKETLITICIPTLVMEHCYLLNNGNL